MMNDEFLKLVSVLGEKKANTFFDNTKASVNSIEDVTKVVRDLSWIELLEETIPYIDSIVRNPRRYIVSEEELIPVEKTRKVTEESVKHLAKHTSLIQDIDEQGMVKPLKLLNVFKEETFDVYENRFIYSLIVNTKNFLQDQLELDVVSLKGKSVKSTVYKSETVIDGEKVKININIETEKEEEVSSSKGSLDDRIKRSIEIFNDFLGTEFIRSLKNVMPVRSPIRKTNVILKDKNFIKCVLLWEMIEKFDVKNSVRTSSIRKLNNNKNMASKLGVGAYLNYFSINESISDAEENNLFIKKLIESYISKSSFNEKEFKAMLNKEYKEFKSKRDNIYIEIRHEFRNNLIKHENCLKKSLLFLK